MHSLVIDAHPTVMTEGAGATPVLPLQDSHGSDPMSGHDPGSMNVLHLCLAVLGAAVALIGLVLLATARRAAPPARSWALARQRRSSPRAPPTASARLAELCVLRR
jgi:hypothetical protein